MSRQSWKGKARHSVAVCAVAYPERTKLAGRRRPPFSAEGSAVSRRTSSTAEERSDVAKTTGWDRPSLQGQEPSGDGDEGAGPCSCPVLRWPGLGAWAPQQLCPAGRPGSEVVQSLRIRLAAQQQNHGPTAVVSIRYTASPSRIMANVPRSWPSVLGRLVLDPPTEQLSSLHRIGRRGSGTAGTGRG